MTEGQRGTQVRPAERAWGVAWRWRHRAACVCQAESQWDRDNGVMSMGSRSHGVQGVYAAGRRGLGVLPGRAQRWGWDWGTHENSSPCSLLSLKVPGGKTGTQATEAQTQRVRGRQQAELRGYQVMEDSRLPAFPVCFGGGAHWAVLRGPNGIGSVQGYSLNHCTISLTSI